MTARQGDKFKVSSKCLILMPDLLLATYILDVVKAFSCSDPDA